MREDNPVATVAAKVEALMRGENLPAPTSREAEALRQAMRCLLAGEAYPRATAVGRNELALMVLKALNARMRADVESAIAIGRAGGGA